MAQPDGKGLSLSLELGLKTCGFGTAAQAPQTGQATAMNTSIAYLRPTRPKTPCIDQVGLRVRRSRTT
jgi:hypothetical protein